MPKRKIFMNITEKEYSLGARVGIIDTKKFKSDYFCISYTLPMTEYNISAATVLALVMSRGTEKHKTVLDINRHLVTLYDVDLCTYVSKTASALTLRISASMLDSAYADDKTDVFSGTLDFINELLFYPLAAGGEMSAAYTESEKKRALDRIKAEINNKDKLALKRANAIAYEGTPYALSENGTPECIESLTPKKLFDMLSFIVRQCPAYAVFAGNLTEQKQAALDAFMARLADKNRGAEFFEGETALLTAEMPKAVVEQVCAKQGRMVLNYRIEKRSPLDAAPMVFDEIFGASPVSRLFMNVRERLSLCYYCASSYNMPLGTFTVRSGLDRDKSEAAKAEIARQIELLSSPENISDEELEMAKLSRISVYKALSDSTSRYADWVLSRRLMGAPADTEQMIAAINSVTKEDVSLVARRMRLALDYFLDGREED